MKRTARTWITLSTKIPPGLISAEDVLDLLKSSPRSQAFLDVRSEDEFEKSGLPFFVNIPILTNQERHEVGLSYKQNGQESAVKLGFSLVTPDRVRREDSWLSEIDKSETKTAIVTCWRGGMRSKLASEWLEKRGAKSLRVIGGYKAIRRALLTTLETLPEFLVLSGLTGSAKSRALQRPDLRKAISIIDLEQLARHRGSTFGRMLAHPQPMQATFENHVLLGLWKMDGTVLVEDESLRIGKVSIPLQMKKKMDASDVVILKSTLDARVRCIFEEYILEPSQAGFSDRENAKAILSSLAPLRERLGDARFREIWHEIEKAFEVSWLSFESHRNWIQRMLVEYYDQLYTYSFNRLERKTVFEGSEEECVSWIKIRQIKKYASPKP